MHSAIVVEKRGALKIWTILLAILAFSLSLVGTFIVRSGVLTSVHAFAVDPTRGLFILIILAIFVGGSLSLFALRAPGLKAGVLFAPVSRESGLVMNNILLCCACAAVFIGTLYPLALESVTGEKISVGPPFFNFTFGPIMLPLLLLMPVGPILTWKRAEPKSVLQKLSLAAILAISLGLAMMVATQRGPWLAPVGMALGAWAVLGSLKEFSQRIGFGQVPWATSYARFRGLSRSSYGTTLAHAGMGLLIIGVIILSVWKQERILAMKPGEAVEIAGYTVTYDGEQPLHGANFDGLSGKFRVSQGTHEIANVLSEKRFFRPGNVPTTEVGLVQGLMGDIYIVMGDESAPGIRNVRVTYNPLASWIWLGATIMFFGGLLSLTDRRLRIGVPKRAAAPQLQAAE